MYSSANGRLLVASQGTNTLKEVDAQANVTVLANGNAIDLGAATAVACAPDGSAYIAVPGHLLVSDIAGNVDEVPAPADGLESQRPGRGGTGHLYVSDLTRNVVRRVAYVPDVGWTNADLATGFNAPEGLALATDVRRFPPVSGGRWGQPVISRWRCPAER